MLSSIVKAYESGDFVKGLFSNDGITASIDFLNAPDLSIKIGTRGPSAFLSIKMDTDGKYYWTKKDDWLLNIGAKMLASDIAPQLRVNSKSNNWEISTNSGTLWLETSEKTVGDDLLSVDGVKDTDNTLVVTLADGKTKLVFPIATPLSLGNPDNSDPIISKRYQILPIQVKMPSGLKVADYSNFEVEIAEGRAASWRLDFKPPTHDQQGNCLDDAKMTVMPDFEIKIGEKATIKISIIDKQGLVFSSATRDIEFKRFELGEYYPDYDNPATALGVIYALDAENPRAGKMISIKEHSALLWGDYNSITADNAKVGLFNMFAIRAIDPTFADYPAFRLINDMNDLPKSKSMIWYIPAIDELVEFYTVWSANKALYNKKLIDAGGLEILGGDFSYRYWSSTGMPGGVAAAFDFTTGTRVNIQRKLLHRVRGMATYHPDYSDQYL